MKNLLRLIVTISLLLSKNIFAQDKIIEESSPNIFPLPPKDFYDEKEPKKVKKPQGKKIAITPRLRQTLEEYNLPSSGLLKENKARQEFITKADFADAIRKCLINDDVIKVILYQIKKHNNKALTALPRCYRLNRKLILKATLFDPMQFQYADDVLKDDPLFIKRILKFYPEVLQFASPRLLSDKYFMEKATYISRNSLEYADKKIRDNKPFMKKMIVLDSKNYIFASERLRAVKDFAKMSFNDDGLLLSFAPLNIRSDKETVEIAVKSNASALEYASKKLQKDKELRILADRKSLVKRKDLAKFLKDNYLVKEKKRNLGYSIKNEAKFFSKNQLFRQNYISKWQRKLDYEHNDIIEDIHLIQAKSRNYPNSWKESLNKFPDIIKKIDKFFLRHYIDQETINSMKLTYFWKIKDKPLTYAFNLYSLRDSNDGDLGPDFSNVNSITAVVQKTPEKWNMTIIQVIIDSEVKMNVAYKNGHKQYILWDLYFANETDDNPKLIFKVEDKFEEYFEIFEEQANGKYKLIYRMNPLKEMLEEATINFVAEN